MNIDLTPIVQAVITLIAVVITSALMPWIRTKLSQEQFQRGVNLAKIAVQAAEQIFGPGAGEEKFNYVTTYLANVLKVDELTLKNMIEAAVFEIQDEVKDACNGGE